MTRYNLKMISNRTGLIYRANNLSLSAVKSILKGPNIRVLRLRAV